MTRSTARARLGKHALPPLDPHGETVSVSLKLPKRLLVAIDALAAKRGAARSAVIREALTRLVE